MNVGFVGTGTMGAPMLANLVREGVRASSPTTVVPAGPRERRKSAGATRAESAAGCLRGAAISSSTMLPSSSHIENPPTSAKNGIAEGLHRGAGSVWNHVHGRSPRSRAAWRRRSPRKGRPLIDAPVSGRRGRARRRARLAIMVGGEARDVRGGAGRRWRRWVPTFIHVRRRRAAGRVAKALPTT